MFSFVIVVNDNGELKTITQDELEEEENKLPDRAVETLIQDTLDARSMEQSVSNMLGDNRDAG